MMNKRALLLKIKEFLNSDKAGRILGGSAGAAIGGLGGALLTGALTDNKALRILGAVVGASAGGYGGYRVGNYMDQQRLATQSALEDSEQYLATTQRALAKSEQKLTDANDENAKLNRWIESQTKDNLLWRQGAQKAFRLLSEKLNASEATSIGLQQTIKLKNKAAIAMQDLINDLTANNQALTRKVFEAKEKYKKLDEKHNKLTSNLDAAYGDGWEDDIALILSAAKKAEARRTLQRINAARQVLAAMNKGKLMLQRTDNIRQDRDNKPNIYPWLKQ